MKGRTMGTLVNENTINQNNIIRNHLLQYGEIDRDTSRAICDCDRLPSRIWDLRHTYGMNIRTVRVQRKNRFGHWESHAIYKLEKEEETT